MVPTSSAQPLDHRVWPWCYELVVECFYENFFIFKKNYKIMNGGLTTCFLFFSILDLGEYIFTYKFYTKLQLFTRFDMPNIQKG